MSIEPYVFDDKYRAGLAKAVDKLNSITKDHAYGGYSMQSDLKVVAKAVQLLAELRKLA